MSPLSAVKAALLLATAGRAGAFRAINPLWTTTEITDVLPKATDDRLEYRQSPCSDHGFIVQKNGVLSASSRTLGQTGFVFEYPDDEVYTWADHGALGMELHPDFPATPYLFLFLSLDNTPPWNDTCPNLVNGMSLCKSFGRLARFTLDVTMDGNGTCTNIGFTPTAANPYTLMEGLCSTSNTHGIGDIKFYGKTLLLTSGDLSQASGQDHGFPEDDCFLPNVPLPQGRFRSQRLDFLNGKVWQIYENSLAMTTGRLQYPRDFKFVAIGMRQPYALAVDRSNGWVYVGDVGSNIREEINYLTPADFSRTTPLNFGWPCIEGTKFLNPTGAGADKTWIQTKCIPATMDCDVCKTIYPCSTNPAGTGGCSADYRAPGFEYRKVTLDPDYVDECTGASSAMTGLAVFNGSNPLFGSTGKSFMPNNLVALDYGSGCMWYFTNKADGTPDFAAGAHLLLADHNAASLIAAKDGYLYSTTTRSPFNLFRHGIASVNDPPVARLALSVKDATTGAYNTCTGTCQVPVGATVRLDASSSSAGGTLVSQYNFDYGDGTSVVKTVPTSSVDHVYATAGVAYAKLVVKDEANHTDSTYRTIIVGQGVSISMTPATGQWSLGDQISYTLQLPPSLATAAIVATATVSHCFPNACTGVDDCHTHPWNMDPGYGVGPTGKITPGEHDMPSTMVLIFTISPPGKASFDMTFETRALQWSATLQTAVVGVAGAKWWPIGSGELDLCKSPCVQPYMAKNTAVLSANQFQTDSLGNIYRLNSWDSLRLSGRTVVIGTTPLTAAVISRDGMTFTARYDAITTPVLGAAAGVSPPALVALTGRYKALELAWELLTLNNTVWDWVIVSVQGVTPVGDFSATFPTEDTTSVTVPVPVAANQYRVAIAAYSSSLNARTAFGPTYSTSSSASSATQLCAFDPYGPYPSGASRIAIPGTIEFEYYALGGNGIGYYDTTPGNGASYATYFRKDDVDINKSGSGSGAIDVDATEWLNYPISVANAGSYNITFYIVLVATSAQTRTVLLTLDRADCPAAAGGSGGAALATMTIPSGFPNKQKTGVLVSGVQLPSGDHTLRVCIGPVVGFKIDSMVFAAPASGPTPTPTPRPVSSSPTTSPTLAPTIVSVGTPAPTTKTLAPTTKPTALPTSKTGSSSPTLAPSASPTAFPTRKTRQPTPAPTIFSPTTQAPTRKTRQPTSAV